MADPWSYLGYLPWAFVLGGLLFGRHRRQDAGQHPAAARDLAAAARVVVGSRSADTETSQVYLHVSYEYAGEQRTFWNRYSSTPLGRTTGRNVDILVNPEDPQEAVVATGAANGRAFGISFALLGLVVLTVGLVQLTRAH